jgi:hypothetical protein
MTGEVQVTGIDVFCSEDTSARRSGSGGTGGPARYVRARMSRADDAAANGPESSGATEGPLS